MLFVLLGVFVLDYIVVDFGYVVEFDGIEDLLVNVDDGLLFMLLVWFGDYIIFLFLEENIMYKFQDILLVEVLLFDLMLFQDLIFYQNLMVGQG